MTESPPKKGREPQPPKVITKAETKRENAIPPRKNIRNS